MTNLIEFENVSKAYRLGNTTSGLREAVPNMLQRLLGRKQNDDGDSQVLWSLRDLTFSVKPGEALGLVGPNGAGKTTTLKLISNITKPSHGNIRTNGRISALIELGAGFHPELTGQENIYLNAAMLGMTRREIKRKFDAIVEFSELKRFLDTPVKRYSSGMYCRLGFAVAAHVDPDILLTDEVLAVGDTAFQTKCFQRIAELKKRGTTIVFVTHNLPTLRRLCDRAILLHRGQMVAEGEPVDVINTYLDNPKYASNLVDLSDEMIAANGAKEPLKSEGPVSITNVTFLDPDGRPTTSCSTGNAVTVRISYLAHQAIPEPSVTIKFHGLGGTQYGGYNSGWDGAVPTLIEGSGAVDVTFDPLCLLPNLYMISVLIADRDGLELYDWHKHAYRLRVLSNSAASAHGLLYMPHRWQWHTNGNTPIPAQSVALEKH